MQTNAGVLDHIREAADTVLGTMFLSPVVEGAQVLAGEWTDPITVGLDFQGRNLSGKCGLVTSEDTARKLSNAFLSADDRELSRHAAWEVMCELSNMFCGRFLARVDSRESFRLSPPSSWALGDIGPMLPLHRSMLQTAHGGLLFLVALSSDARNDKVLAMHERAGD